MARRRVYEIAKELEMTSKEVLTQLNDAGLELKSASSSVEEDVALEVLGKKKVEEEAELPKKRVPGLIIRKKAKQIEEPTPAVVEESIEATPEAEEPIEEAQPDVEDDEPVIEAATEDSQVSETTPEAEAVSIETDQGEAVPAQPEEQAPEPAVDLVQEDKPVKEEATPMPEHEAAAAPSETAAQEKQPEQVQQPTLEAEQVPQPAEIPKAQPQKQAKAKERKPLAQVVYMIDKEKLMERIPSRRGPARQDGERRRPRSPAPSRQAPQVQDFSPAAAPPPTFGQVTEVDFRGGHDRRRSGGGGGGGGQRERDNDRNKRAAPAASGKRQQLTKRDLLEMRDRNIMTSRLRKKKIRKGTGKTQITQPKESKRVVKMGEHITVADLAHQLGVKAAAVIKQLMGLGMMITQNDVVDFDTATLIANEYKYTVENIQTTEEDLIPTVEDNPDDLKPRYPVVTVMGHVDHGKTSILDAIRASDVASHEHGGITQHIGAYAVETKSGIITFIDTPGHAAFTSMRARGAQVTDLVILVVAADDGVMPQTKEAISHSQAADVPIIVAINKCDTPGANPERVKQSLTEYNLIPEDWGGETLFVETSAVTREGIDDLLDTILLQAEMLELQANPDKPMQGVVIEAQLDKGRGPVATVLVQEGTLRVGDFIVAGSIYGKVRALVDARGKRLKNAGPSMPVEILGLGEPPAPGDTVNVVKSLDVAKDLVELREDQSNKDKPASAPMSLEDLLSRMGTEEKKELRIVVKADVQGSMEAVSESLSKLVNDEVEVKVIHSGVGGITESDVILAAASQAIIVGFNVRPDRNASTAAEKDSIEIKLYRVIYDAIEEIEAAMNGMLKPVITEKVLGQALVQETFRIPKVGTIAGCNVQNGKILRNAQVRLIRDSIVIYEGKISSLKRFKDDVREVNQGYECGIGIEGYNDIKLDDVIEAFVMEEIDAMEAQKGKRA